MIKAPIRKISNYLGKKRPDNIQDLIENTKKEISNDPTSYKLHEKIAGYYYQTARFLPVIAECRTSITLGNNSHEVYILLIKSYLKLGQNNTVIYLLKEMNEILKKKVLKVIKNLDNLKEHKENKFLLNYDHNQFYRLNSISEQVNRIGKGRNMSVLDVGGGVGLLSLFLPDIDYVLAEPTINGISNSEFVLFKNIKFDIVVACHIIEHIEENKKIGFLDSLCSLTKNKVILLNPFNLEPKRSKKHLELIYKMTEAPWAKEHLECGLPTLELIRKYAEKKQYGYKCYPNGTFSTTISHVFLNYFASVSGKTDELKDINYLFNKELIERLEDSDNDPTAYLIELSIN